MLDVHGDVEIAFGTGSGRLVADGRGLVFDVDDAPTLARLVGRRSLELVAVVELDRVGCTLHVRSGGRLLLVAGRDAEPGFLSHLFRLPRVELNPWSAIRSALGPARSGP